MVCENLVALALESLMGLGNCFLSFQMLVAWGSF
jgi:hypothetical protein